MNDLKIFQIEEYWVLTYNKKEALEILIDEGFIDDDLTLDDIAVEECDYKEKTYQPLSTLKNIFSERELKIIEKVTEDNSFVFEVDGVEYFFDWFHEGDYPAVVLTFEKILNNPKILSTFDKNSVISTTNI
jgi:hypothetical protein